MEREGRLSLDESRWTLGRARHRLSAVVAILLVLGALGCGSRKPPPGPGQSSGAVPDLTGRRVMVLPVQQLTGLATGGVDAELAFALRSRLGDVEWIPPDALRSAVETSPSLDVRLEGLPVGVFLRTEVERVGDPLFGVLIRLAAVTGGEAALIPVLVRYREGVPEAPGAVEVAAALLDVRSGYVLWFGIEEGRPGAADDPAALATALDALARRLAVR